MVAALLIFFLGAAAYSVFVVFHRPSIPALDVYAQFVPNILHAIQGFWDGGKGLLWNPFQACGRPFFANPIIGVLYPPHLLFLFLDVNTAVHIVLIFNMVVGAIGMFLLCREIGLGWLAAVAGAVVFELGNPMIELTSWSPTHNGPWTWIPWVMLCCERLLRAPTPHAVVGLAFAVALELLPGFVLITALTYQLIALRVGFELVARRGEHPWRSAAAIAAGLALGPLLVAIQLVPAAELAMHSSRVTAFGWELLRPRSLANLISSIVERGPPAPLLVVPLLLVAIAPFVPAKRGLAGLAYFYLAVGVLHCVLALGPATPLYDWYTELPMVKQTVRVHLRLFWVASFSLSLLTAFAIEWVAESVHSPTHRRVGPVLVGAAAVALYFLTPGGLRAAELAVLLVTFAAFLVAVLAPQVRRYAAWTIVAAITVNLIAVPMRWPGSLLPSADILWRHADAFAAIDQQLTPQDRVWLIPSLVHAVNLKLTDKTSTILRVPNIGDYEALLDQRFHTYYLNMRFLDDQSRAFQRLLDLMSVRYIIASPTADAPEAGMRISPVLIKAPDLRGYLNDSAFHRARFVPRIEVERNPAVLLDRLANGNDDLAEVALVEELPPSGFTGVAGSHRGATGFLTNDPEHLSVLVDAPERGFLVLSDLYSPGWRASVDGADVPILRANYTFRLIEVPAGRFTVDFRYRPMSVLIGAILSALGLAVVVGLSIWGRRNSRPSAT
jgi:hypothetical protein